MLRCDPDHIFTLEHSVTTREPCTVLIVDDDRDIRNLLSLLLKGEGYYVDVASDGEEAISILKGTLKPCLVMLDLMMPGMSGCELLEIISRDATLDAIPVVVASAIPALAKPYASNVKAYVTKPFSVDTILSVVRENCREHRHSVPV